MWLDISIAVALAILTIVMGYFGVHVTLHPTDSPKEKLWYKGGFITCAALAVCLVVWQGVRNGRSQKGFQKQVEMAASESQKANLRIDQLTREQQSEIARRQQAEKDLALIVQTSGRATREGVVSDIKSSPIKVEVKGGNEPPTPIRIPNINLTWDAVVSVHDDAKFCNRMVFQSDIAVDPIALIVMLSADAKYADVLLTDARFGGAAISKTDAKRIEIGARGMGMPLLRPDNPFVMTVCSTESFKPLTVQRAQIR